MFKSVLTCGGLVAKLYLTLATPWTVACQAPLSMEFSRHEYWSGLPLLTCSVVKNLPANAGDANNVSLIPGLGRSPGEGYCIPLQYSCLGKPMDRRSWWATVHGVNLATKHAHKISSAENILSNLCVGPDGLQKILISKTVYDEQTSGLPV